MRTNLLPRSARADSGATSTCAIRAVVEIRRAPGEVLRVDHPERNGPRGGKDWHTSPQKRPDTRASPGTVRALTGGLADLIGCSRIRRRGRRQMGKGWARGRGADGLDR